MRCRIFVMVYMISTSSLSALTLDEAFIAARTNTASVKTRVLDKKIAQEQRRQAIAQVLPSLSVSSQQIWLDPIESIGAFGDGTQHTAALTLSQDIFQGGSEIGAIEVGKNLPKIAQLDLQQSEITLYGEVANAYLEVLRIQRDLKSLSEQVTALETRVADLQRRARIGRTKATDVLAARSQLARTEGEKSTLESTLLRAKMSLMNITGLDSLEPLDDIMKPESLEVEASWAELVAKSPEVASAELSYKNAEGEVLVATGSYWPQVSASGNYYLDRAGILQESEWDVTLRAEWSLFEGGSDQAERRIQVYEAKKLEAEYRDLRRQRKNEFAALIKEFVLRKSVVSKLKLAVDLADKNYKQHLKEFRSGLVSNLDVLQALQDKLSTRRTLDREIFETTTAWYRLRTLAGVQP